MLRPTATKVTALDNCKLLINFTSGEKKIFDTTPYIQGSWYSQLADKNYFQSAFANGYTVEWPHGQDLCPDEIYYNSIQADCYLEALLFFQ